MHKLIQGMIADFLKKIAKCLSTMQQGRWKKPLFPISGLLVDESRSRGEFQWQEKKSVDRATLEMLAAKAKADE